MSLCQQPCKVVNAKWHKWLTFQYIWSTNSQAFHSLNVCNLFIPPFLWSWTTILGTVVMASRMHPVSLVPNCQLVVLVFWAAHQWATLVRELLGRLGLEELPSWAGLPVGSDFWSWLFPSCCERREHYFFFYSWMTFVPCTAGFRTGQELTSFKASL